MDENRFQELLTQKGWSVPKLHKISGVSKSTIYKMLKGERGKQSKHNTITKLADALGVTPKELIGEEKPQEPTNQREQNHIQFATRDPEVNVLADHPLDPQKAFLDNFNLRGKLGPLYDVLRDPKTRTPMAIAIYGDWGTGKTSAMRWLHGLINLWNDYNVPENKIRVQPVWFYPWKYDNKKDVWRGLIWEVVIASIAREQTTVQTIKYAAKRFGPFLGKSFLHTLISIRLKTKALNDTTDPRAGLADIQEILTEYENIARSEEVYLNEFESSLKEWLETTLAQNERMVIFIDDLDRCAPEVTLQVVEAMNLYLNIEKLIFVIGVDKKVIQELVDKHYEKLGLSKEKSKDYLAKMFQVEIHLTPTEQQISHFLDEQLKEIPYWKEPHLSKDEGVLFRGLIFELAERNPREVKRLINSALMTGSGAMMLKGGGLKFDQGLQLFFIRKILDDRYTMGSEVGSKRVITFFIMWSEIVCTGREKNPRFPCSIKVPKELGKAPPEEVRSNEVTTNIQGIQIQERPKEPALDLSFAPSAYRALLENPKFSGLLNLLSDEDLGQLMTIPFPTYVSEITALMGTTKNADLIREAIARHIDKKPDELTNEDYSNVTSLNLGSSEISDLEPIKQLGNLEELYIGGSQVSKLESIKQLTSLKRLGLGSTNVSDLDPIKQLTKLEYLDLSGTQVSELEAIKGLTNLQTLYLGKTQVSDIEPIRQLTSLKRLDLKNTRVSDLEPIKGLTSLEWLDLQGTQVSNIEPIKQFTSLQELDLRDTQVSDLETIKQLALLQRLNLTNTQVRNLEPIKGLKNLRWVVLRDTRVANLEQIKKLKNLEGLDVRGTKLSNEQIEILQESLPELKIVR